MYRSHLSQNKQITQHLVETWWTEGNDAQTQYIPSTVKFIRSFSTEADHILHVTISFKQNRSLQTDLPTKSTGTNSFRIYFHQVAIRVMINTKLPILAVFAFVEFALIWSRVRSSYSRQYARLQQSACWPKVNDAPWLWAGSLQGLKLHLGCGACTHTRPPYSGTVHERGGIKTSGRTSVYWRKPRSNGGQGAGTRRASGAEVASTEQLSLRLHLRRSTRKGAWNVMF